MNASSADSPAPRVSVVIPNWNGAAWLEGCLEALDRQEYRGFETILVDNGSTDGSLDLAGGREDRLKVIALERNQGFARAVNRGVAEARGTYVAVLNTDTAARPSWLGTLVETLDSHPPDVGGVAPLTVRMDDPDTVDDAGDALSWTGAARKLGHGEPARHYATPREVLAPSGAAALYRRSFLEAMGGYDEAFFAYLEDVDLGLRGRLCGYRFLLEPSSVVRHQGHGSGLARGSYVRLVTRNRLMLFAKNVPGALLLEKLPRLAYGQLYFLVVYRAPLDSLLGYASFVRQLPHVVRERRWLRGRVRISLDELRGLLDTEMREPPLRTLLARRLRRLRS